jgi:DNA-binding beta-propeller fold protein YncE
MGGLAIDSSSNLYVADFDTNQVLVFASPLSSSSRPAVILTLPGQPANIAIGK